jgi:hypothetical protein
MSKFDRKLEQIQLQHRIMEILREDNGVSPHFDYHINITSDNETVRLNLLTYNERHSEYMLLHSYSGKSSIDCLNKMLGYIQTNRSNQQTEYSFTINWKKKADNHEYKSYFLAFNQSDAEKKFLYEKNVNDYEYKITQNPIS